METCTQPVASIFLSRLGNRYVLAGTTCEHLSFSIALKVPTFVVVSKTDLCDEAGMKEVVQQLQELLVLPGCSKVPVVIHSENDVYSTAQHFTDNR